MVLGDYALAAIVRDPDAVIIPPLVYVSPDFWANEKPLTKLGSGWEK